MNIIGYSSDKKGIGYEAFVTLFASN